MRVLITGATGLIGREIVKRCHEKEIKILFPEINFEKVLVMALVHDDVEIVIGDFASADRLNCSQDQLENLDTTEMRGIEVLSQKYPESIH